jgi:hypothetical protein
MSGLASTEFALPPQTPSPARSPRRWVFVGLLPRHRSAGLVHVVLRDTYWDYGEGSPTLHSVAVALGAVHPVCM